MVAAATAVDNGATVIVLEKMAMLGGNTAPKATCPPWPPNPKSFCR